jgi:hypothetical protein
MNFLIGEFSGHVVEGIDAGAAHSQDGGDRQSPVGGDLITMRFGSFLNQAVRAGGAVSCR